MLYIIYVMINLLLRLKSLGVGREGEGLLLGKFDKLLLFKWCLENVDII